MKTLTRFQWSSTAALIAVLAIATMAWRHAPAEEDRAAILQWERDAAAAKHAGDVAFFEKNLMDDWTGGLSSGAFETKQSLIASLRHADAIEKDSVSSVAVRVYGDAAIATYSRSYEVVVDGGRLPNESITTESFVRWDGRWIQVAAHSSIVKPTP